MASTPMSGQTERRCQCGERIVFTWGWERSQKQVSEAGINLVILHHGQEQTGCHGIMQLIQLQITNWLARTRTDIVRTINDIIDTEDLWLPVTSDVESADSPATSTST